VIVQVDDEGIRGEDAGTAPWAVRWAELERVGLQTTEQGPFEDDVFWLLHTASAVHRVPQGAEGEGELLRRLQALPGFDNEAVIEAMASTGNQAWVCWERGGGKGSRS
jgi:hypothetical protein